MLKKVAINTFALFFAINFISCSDFLEKDPVSDLDTKKFWRSEQDANAALNGMYFSFSRAMSNGYYDWGEIRGGNWSPHLQFGDRQRELISHEIPNDNRACEWTKLYQTILRANLALKYIPGISIPNESKDAYLGEAYAMRALCYFYAVRTWGDVPVFREPVEKYDVDLVYPRRTNRETVLDLIQSDLTLAEQLLPAKPLGTPSSTAAAELKYRTRLSSKPAVYALMMDVYAWRHDYDMVIKMYEEKIAPLSNSETGWGLEPNLTSTLAQNEFTTAYRTMFDKDKINPSDNLPMTCEMFFTVYYHESENGTNQTRPYFNYGSQQVDLTDDYVASIAPDDKRFAASFIDGGGGTNAKYRLHKYWVEAIDRSKPSDNYLPIYRYSDVVLLYAEALYMRDKFAEAINQMNRIRARSGVKLAVESDYVTDQTKLLDDILHERRVELIGEGKYWFDLIRTGNTQRMANCADNKIYFPIYRDHILQNPNLSLPPL